MTVSENQTLAPKCGGNGGSEIVGGISTAPAPEKPKYVISDLDKNGNRRWYIRRPNHRKVRLPCGQNNPAFLAAYNKCAPLPAKTAKPTSQRRNRHMSTLTGGTAEAGNGD